MADTLNFKSLTTVKLATPYRLSTERMDPSKIPDLNAYQYMASMYSRLFYLDDQNKISNMAADAISWQGSTLKIKIKKWKTVDGYEISAKDVAFSLKRLFILDSNSHGFVKDLICPNIKLSSPFEDCPGIEFQDNELHLTVVDPSKKNFLLSLLTSADYSIIPMPCVDVSRPEFPIIDFRNTSGPYYANEKFPNFIDSLNWNHNFFWDSDKRAKYIELVVFGDAEAASKAIIENEIDIIPKNFFFPYKLFKDLKKNSNIKVSETYPIEQVRVYLMNHFVEQISVEERLMAMLEIEDLLKEMGYFDIDCKNAKTLFPTILSGDLTSDQLSEIEDLRKRIREKLTKLSKRSKPYKSVFWALGQNGLPKSVRGKLVELVERSELPEKNLPTDDYPFRVLPVDAPFYEDISLLAYEFASSHFGMNSDEGRKWISDYMEIVSQDDRVPVLREFHYSVLTRGLAHPICARPYYVIHNQMWKDQTPKLMASSPWWMFCGA